MSFKIRTSILPFVIAMLGSLSGCGATPPSPPSLNDAATLKSEPVTVAAFHEVSDDLFRSGHVNDGQYRWLADQGIKSIVSLEDYNYDASRADAERLAAAAVGIEFSWQPMDPSAKPTLAQINQALAAFDALPKPVLVHCRYGHDRTGITVAAYRIRYEHWDLERAKAEMRSLGHLPSLFWWDDVLDNVH